MVQALIEAVKIINEKVENRDELREYLEKIQEKLDER